MTQPRSTFPQWRQLYQPMKCITYGAVALSTSRQLPLPRAPCLGCQAATAAGSRSLCELRPGWLCMKIGARKHGRSGLRRGI